MVLIRLAENDGGVRFSLVFPPLFNHRLSPGYLTRPIFAAIRDMPLYGEFIEMTKDRMRRMAQLEKADDPDSEPEPERIMLYIHGGWSLISWVLVIEISCLISRRLCLGAYFFSSLDTHRCVPIVE